MRDFKEKLVTQTLMVKILAIKAKIKLPSKCQKWHGNILNTVIKKLLRLSSDPDPVGEN